MTRAFATTSFGLPSARSEEHTSELQSHVNLVCRLLLEKKKTTVWLLRTDKQKPSSRSGGSSTIRMMPQCGNLSLTASVFFFNDTATTEIYTLSLHDALPI